MKYCLSIHLLIMLLTFTACNSQINKEKTDYNYYDVPDSDTICTDALLAVTREDYLEFGSSVAYVNLKGDTVIPFGTFAYFGTDTLIHFATVLEFTRDSIPGRPIAIDRNQNILFDLVMFDNGPESFHDGLVRVLRNGKMGFANPCGQIVIPCIYDYAKWFDNGHAEVTFKAKKYSDGDEHSRVESKEWFTIDKKGHKLE